MLLLLLEPVVARMKKQFPTALWRYCMGFLEWSIGELYVLSGVSKQWHSILTHGTAQRAVVTRTDYTNGVHTKHIQQLSGLHFLTITRHSDLSGWVLTPFHNHTLWHLTALRGLCIPADLSFSPAAFQHLGSLREFETKDCGYGEDASHFLGNGIVLSHLPDLKSLGLCSLSIDDAWAINRIAKSLQKLTALRIYRQFIPVKHEAEFFRCLTNLRELHVAKSWRPIIASRQLQLLSNLRSLCISGCDQLSDTAFTTLRRLTRLDMSKCDQRMITGAAFSCMPALRVLVMHHCHQIHNLDAVFTKYLTRLVELDVSDCGRSGITDAAFAGFESLTSLAMRNSNQSEITNKAFEHLGALECLDMSGCTQVEITDEAFRHLVGLRSLTMAGCCQAGITDEAFRHLGNLVVLDMRCCNQPGITTAAFRHLTNLSADDIQKAMYHRWPHTCL